jgi:hypothetical protein
LSNLIGAPKSVEGDFDCLDNELMTLEGAPQLVGGNFHIKLSYIDKKYYHVSILEIEDMLGMGIKFDYPYIAFVENYSLLCDIKKYTIIIR